jgi:hypothetical protein
MRGSCVGRHNLRTLGGLSSSYIFPQRECTSLADGFKLAQNMLKESAPKHLHGPMSFAVI